jgi:hypothetical protein
LRIEFVIPIAAHPPTPLSTAIFAAVMHEGDGIAATNTSISRLRSSRADALIKVDQRASRPQASSIEVSQRESIMSCWDCIMTQRDSIAKPNFAFRLSKSHANAGYAPWWRHCCNDTYSVCCGYFEHGGRGNCA